MRILVFLVIILNTILPATRAAEPFFKPGDVVALVGGEDMVVAAELGYLETLIQLALPDHKLKFRSLAREGDTVFEQRRDLNYPKLEDQLDKMGATVVICQFGQMESLAAGAAGSAVAKDEKAAKDKKDAGKADVPLVPSVLPVPEDADAKRKAKVAEFVAAYDKLIGRLRGKDGARRIIILQNQKSPNGNSFDLPRIMHFNSYSESLDSLKSSLGVTILKTVWPAANERWSVGGIDLNNQRHLDIATSARFFATNTRGEWVNLTVKEDLRALIAAKNRLWFHYYRPQNWAFLAGDRTNQPSSRDHLDRNKRWFPEELEKFVPLIDAKDAEIWALAKKLSAQGGK